jgi:transposase InsO family protein
MLRIPTQQRPHYTPVDRLAILELRAIRGWSLAQTAERLLLTPTTVASWMRRLDEEGPAAIVQTREPVNKYPAFVAYIVRTLKTLAPSLGYVKTAQFLCRAGLHLSATTIRRLQGKSDPTRSNPEPARSGAVSKAVKSRHPNHTWLCDLTTVPISLGFWVPWMPRALPQCWPFCWWVAVVVDHYSRRILGFALYRQQPTSHAIKLLLARIIRRTGCHPRYLITDQGEQSCADAFRAWTRRRGIQQRFGALGQHGCIALVERLIRTIKQECTRRLLVPYRERLLQQDLNLFSIWYNRERPHSGLNRATPDEVYFGVRPASMRPRFEPRPEWPRSAPCAGPPAKLRGRPGVRLELQVDYLGGRQHLPLITLRPAA